MSAQQLATWLVAAGQTVSTVAQVAAAPPVGASEPGSPPAPGYVAKHGELSEREIEVLSLIGSGLGNDEIAARMFLSINTLKSYIRSAYRKVGLRSRSQAVRWAIEHHLARVGPGDDAPPAHAGATRAMR